MILGRGTELTAVQGFVTSIRDGPVALVLEGAPGIGKTTLWQAGVAVARGQGVRVLSCRAAESEARLSYTGLGDILDVPLPELPAPQKRALDAALLRVDVQGSPPDQRAVSLAFLSVLRTLAASAPLVVAVDDVQWLDAPSARVLSFAIRRLEDQPIGVLLALRQGSLKDPLDLARTGPQLTLHRLTIGPLDENAMTRLLRDRTGGRLTHPVLVRLHRISAGNPFFGLEMARARLERGARPAPGEPLPVPEDLQDLLGARLAAQSSAVLDVLLVVAAAARPTEALVLTAATRRDRAAAALGKAERAGIIQRAEGRIAFAHPLLGSTVYGAATGPARRHVHRRLARSVEDPEERARHLALAASRPDRHVAAALEDAARHARARGAPDAAAELSELARSLTPRADARDVLQRTLDASEYHFDAGDATRSTALLEEAIATAQPGLERAHILFRLASISWLDMRRVEELGKRALHEAAGDTTLLASIHEHLAWVGIYRGDLVSAVAHARASRAHTGGIAEPAIEADSLATFGMVQFLRGRSAEDLMRKAVQFEELATRRRTGNEPTVYTAARACYGLQLLWAGRLDDARRVLHRELAAYESRGRYVVRDELHCYLAELECRAGDWDVARRHAQEAVDIGADSGHLKGRGQMLFPRALVSGLQGHVDAARADAHEGLGISLSNEDHLSASCNRSVLGFVDLSLSDHSAAIDHLKPVLSFLEQMGPAEPGIIPCVPDAIEALVVLGEVDEAEQLTGRLARQGKRCGRPWALATAARCRGLVLAARRDLWGARAALEQSIAEHRRVPQPFDLGRTLLVRGEVERRAKQKRAARASLEEALRIFETLGAPLWAEKARVELARTRAPASRPRELSPTELRIAELVTQGKKNKEIANMMFVSVKTVEANISRIFHKLGVRSRTELARAFSVRGGGSTN